MMSLGIGGNAIIQFASKEFKEVSGTFDRFTNATWLRSGQLGDLAQAAGNTGYAMKNFASRSAGGMSGEVQGNTDNSGAPLTALTDRFNKWVDNYKNRRLTPTTIGTTTTGSHDQAPLVPLLRAGTSAQGRRSGRS
jgi:hypothetical protein